MKLREQEAVLNHGNGAWDWLPESQLRGLCPEPGSTQRELHSPGHFLQERGVTLGAIRGAPQVVFSAAGCRLPHALAVGKKGECVVKNHPYPPRATFVWCGGAADGSPFHCRSRSRASVNDVGGVSSFDTAVPDTSVTLPDPRGRWHSCLWWLLSDRWLHFPGRSLWDAGRHHLVKLLNSACVRAVTRARGGGLQHAVAHSFISVSPCQQLPLRIICKHQVRSLSP